MLYEEIANRIQNQIESGILLPNEKLPSIRELHRKIKVSLTSVINAYHLLEDRGWIESRPQSGFYVKYRRQQIQAPSMVEVPSIFSLSANTSGLATKMVEIERNHHVSRFGIAAPASELLPFKQLNRIVSGLARTEGSRILNYDLPPGFVNLRRQIAKRSLDWGGNLSTEDVVITSGCLEAVNICLRTVAKEGDIIAVESPTYYGTLKAIEALRMRTIEIPTNPTTGIDLNELSRAIRRHPVKACIVATNFSNPTGALLSDQGKYEIVELLSKFNIPLIEDDICGELYFGKSRPLNAKSFDKKNLVMLCSSFSKTVAPGFRIGWCAPGQFKDDFVKIKSATSVASSTPSQMALAQFLAIGGYDRHMRSLRRNLALQKKLLIESIIRHFSADTRMTDPDGGLATWVELPGHDDGIRLFNKAIKKKISFAPGAIFSNHGLYNSFIRLSFSNPWSNFLEESIRTLGELSRQKK